MKLFALLLSVGIAADPVTTAPRDESVPVEVAVRTITGVRVDGAYVAFVSPDRPNARPSFETVLPNGAAKLRLKPGAYKVYAFGKGMQQSSRPVHVSAQSPALVFDLKPAASVGGIVRDENGKPIADASVRHMIAVGPRAIGQVSALARRHLAHDWETRTDAEGHWTLPGRDDGAVPVLIEAPGYAPEHRYYRAAETHTTTLRPGSKLRVLFDRTESDRFVTLIRQTTPNDAAASGWESVAWARPIESTTIVWESLPVGIYSVVVRYVEARRFAHPTTVGTVELVEPAAVGELRAAMPPASSIDRDARALFLAGVTRADLAALEARASTEGSAEEVKHSLETVSGGTVAYLQTTAPLASVVLMTRSAIYAAQNRLSTSPPDGTPVPTVRSPRADASVRIETTDGSPLPRWSTVQFGGCDFPERLVIAAPVAKEGVIELPYPTACRAVALAIPPFAPIVMRASVAPGTRKTFGPYVLKPAASADIHVVRQPSGTSVANAPVRALLRDRTWRTDVTVAEGVADSGGKLRLDGLPSDFDVVFEARVPGSEASAEMLADLEVGRIERVQVQIPEPATLVVVPRLAAEVLEKFPQATIYSVVLEPAESKPSAPAARLVADIQEAAEAVFKSIRPGAWRVSALVRAAGTIQPILIDTISLRPGDVRRLQIAVAPAIIEGRVMSGTGKGTEAQMSFGDPPSAHSVRRFTRTDSLGRFTILLPKRGTYSVEVSPIEAEDRTTIQLGEIAFTDPTRPVPLYLPTGVIRVRVKERDQPVEGAAVKAVYWRESAFAPVVNVERYGTTATGGEAVLNSLTLGRWLIQAVSPGGGYRAEAAVTIKEGDSPPVVTLDLQPPILIQGLTRSSGSSAITAARVNCLFVGPHGVPRVEQSDSDAEGRFSIALSPPPPAALYCGLTTESGHIGAYLLSPSNADLVLPAETGSLTIPDWADNATRDALWLVARDGRMFNLSWFTAKTGKRWGALTVPHVPSGSWKIVRISSPEDWFRLAGAGGNALSPIAEFRIEEGEMKTVHLDSE